MNGTKKAYYASVAIADTKKAIEARQVVATVRTAKGKAPSSRDVDKAIAIARMAKDNGLSLTETMEALALAGNIAKERTEKMAIGNRAGTKEEIEALARLQSALGSVKPTKKQVLARLGSGYWLLNAYMHYAHTDKVANDNAWNGIMEANKAL